MIANIIDRNREIEAARASTDPAVRASVKGVRVTGPATRHRIRSTLRNALNDALIDEVVKVNAAAHVKTPEEREPPMPWTAERVTRWRETGEIPGKVMVWTAEQTGEFLDYAETRAATCTRCSGSSPTAAPAAAKPADSRTPKSAPPTSPPGSPTRSPWAATASSRKRRRAPPGSGTCSTTTTPPPSLIDTSGPKRRRNSPPDRNGRTPDCSSSDPTDDPWRPAGVSQRFNRLVARAGLPPIRLHDLRHVAATVGLQAGIDIKVMQEQLGHSTSTLTRDTYQSVVEELHRDAADRTAQAMKRKNSA